MNAQLRDLLERRAPLATTEPIVMELLAGARDDAHLRGLRKLVLGCELLPLRGLADYEEAAAVYRACRRSGTGVRRLVDCLIAVVAINSRTVLLHADEDFDLIANHSELRLVIKRPKLLGSHRIAGQDSLPCPRDRALRV